MFSRYVHSPSPIVVPQLLTNWLHSDCLDIDLERYMRKYFRKEVKEKAQANDIERGIEDYGPGYVHSSCTVM